MNRSNSSGDVYKRQLLRQVVNIVNEIEFDDADDRHTFGDIYEGILKDIPPSL